MRSPIHLHTVKLSNGVTVSFYDQTKVYFGDYHHVRIRINCSLDNAAVHLKQYCTEHIDFRSIAYNRTLEKMGVPSEDIESVTKALLNDFERNSMPYISTPDFPKKMINNEISCKKVSVRKYLGSGT